MFSVLRLHIAIVLLFSLGLNIPISSASNPSESKARTIYIYHSSTQGTNGDFIEMLVSGIKAEQSAPRIMVIDVDQKTPIELEKQLKTDNGCALTIGPTPLTKILATRTSTPIFSTHVSKFDLDSFVEKYRQFGVTLSGIYQEQSFERQLLLAKAMNSKLKRVAVILGRKTRYYLDDYRVMSNKYGFELSFVILPRNGSASSFVETLANSNTFLAIINDKLHYLPERLHSLLITTHQLYIPILGNKQLDSTQAAMASVFTPSNQLAIEVSREIGLYCNGRGYSIASSGKIRSPTYSHHFKVSVNKQIAQNLNYPAFDEKTLVKTIRNMKQMNLGILQ